VLNARAAPKRATTRKAKSSKATDAPRNAAIANGAPPSDPAKPLEVEHA
jgi:hypothetical protein